MATNITTRAALSENPINSEKTKSNPAKYTTTKCNNSKCLNTVDTKFNVLECGLKEPAEGTPRYQRSMSDLQSVRESLESVVDNLLSMP